MAAATAPVTVIVLARNAGRTVGRALDSLWGQTRRPRQIVVVNDASTDDTLQIAYRWKLEHEQDGIYVDVLSSVGTPIGSAEGTDIALGVAGQEWVMRCDADDALPPRALELLLDRQAVTGADIVSGAIREIRGNMARMVRPSAHWALLNDAPVDTVTFSLCNKIIRRELLVRERIKPFAGADCWEDLGMVSRVLALKPVAASVPDAVYDYYIHSPGESLSGSSHERLLADHLLVAGRLEEWFSARGLDGEYQPWLDRVKLCAKVKLLRGRGKDVARWKATFPEINPRIMGIRQINLIYRLLFAAVALLPAGVSQAVADLLSPPAQSR